MDFITFTPRLRQRKEEYVYLKGCNCGRDGIREELFSRDEDVH